MKYSKEALRRRIYNPDDTYESWGNIFESHILSSGTILSTRAYLNQAYLHRDEIAMLHRMIDK